MERLEQRHVDFLRTCAGSANKVHSLPNDVTVMEADAMAKEGLLIKYNKATGPQYAIARYGAQFVKEGYGATETPEMKKLAVDYVLTKGYSLQAAENIVRENGVAVILQSQADEMRQGSQREVKIPTDENGKAQLKFKG